MTKLPLLEGEVQNKGLGLYMEGGVRNVGWGVQCRVEWERKDVR